LNPWQGCGKTRVLPLALSGFDFALKGFAFALKGFAFALKGRGLSRAASAANLNAALRR